MRRSSFCPGSLPWTSPQKMIVAIRIVLLMLTPLSADGPEIPCRRLFHDRLPVLFDHRVPERTVDAVKGEWFDRLDDPLDGSGRNRDVVGIAVHETDVLAVRHD